MRSVTHALSVVAECSTTEIAGRLAGRLANVSLVDDRTISLKWPGASDGQVDRMRSLMSDLHAAGDLVAPAAVAVVDYDPSAVATTQPVPIGRKIRNAGRAVVRNASQFLQRRPVLSSDDLAAKRYAICEACPHFRNGSCADVVHPDGTVDRGCGCNLAAKVRLQAELCPHGKW
jgi:hypothetical protein